MALPSNLRAYLVAIRKRAERRAILRALAELGTVAKAAEALGVNRTDLHKRMANLGILSPRALRKLTRSRLDERRQRHYGPPRRVYDVAAGGASCAGDSPNTARAARR